jgi:hypothetical protein
MAAPPLQLALAMSVVIQAEASIHAAEVSKSPIHRSPNTTSREAVDVVVVVRPSCERRPPIRAGVSQT